MSGNVCAVVVTFHPDQDYEIRFKAIEAQVEKVIIVDNGSNLGAVKMLQGLIRGTPHQLLRNTCNLGVATAFNQGLRAARSCGYAWALTLDQDSTADPKMVQQLFQTLSAAPDPGFVAMVGPNIVHRNFPGTISTWPRPMRQLPFLFERASCRGQDLDGVTLIVTSGALMNTGIFERLGAFRDDYFIDYVDSEYCLRAMKNGYRNMVSAKATLTHSLGGIEEVSVGGAKIRPRFHSPDRVYYLYRNRVPTLRLYALAFPHWFLFDSLQAAYNLLRILVFEDMKLEKVAACLKGTWHGLRGRLGPQNSPSPAPGESG